MQTTLYYREGSSDKVYSVNVASSGTGYVVNYRYGRRGAALTDGTKTSTPVSLERATLIYQKLIGEKTAKGYSTGENGTPYQDSNLEPRDTGLRPMLLNAIDPEEAQRLIGSNDWGMQEKLDGKRVMIRRHAAKEEYKLGRTVTASNRRGLEIALPLPLVDSMSQLESCILDGELIGETFHAFDLLERSGHDITSFGYASRHAWLVEFLCDSEVSVAALFDTPHSKAQALEAFKAAHAEGVVFKHLSAPYTAHRPSSGGMGLKYKFTESASVIVTNINPQRSVAVGLVDGTPLGNVSIPANSEIPTIGSVIEVRYLYCYRQGSLFQPVFVGERTDVTSDECVVGQLKFKSESDDS